MRTVIVLFVATIAIAVSATFAQQDLSSPDILNGRVPSLSVSVQPRSERPMQYRIPGKRASEYTTEDWGRIIDSTWGPGQPVAEQRQIFETFFNSVRQQWPGFPNLALGCSYWDSVANVYRPQIPDSGLSRGRFYALMSRMWLALTELHTYIVDPKVDTAFGSSVFRYRPGVPLLITGPRTPNVFAVTPLPDSTNLVYRAAPGNPLGLVPGDLVLGYEGVPWKRLYRQLLEAGLPVHRWFSWPGSTPESMTHFYLMAVGHNWGLFDTIDVVKYSSGDTLHLPTALLDTTVQTIWESEQVPVAGVPMPQAPWAVAVSWGVVQGTNIGYIYVWDWATGTGQTQTRFSNAVDSLINIRTVEGLVLDFRMNWGGNYTYGNDGLRQLFNFDPTSNLRKAQRNSATDCMSFAHSTAPGAFTPTTLYDHPIAVLVGPGCFSVGDYNALRMRFHPRARFFGKPTNGAFVAGGTPVQGSLSGGWLYSFPASQTYSNVPGEGYMMHKGLQPDEEVWLTRNGVANGEDDVVNRALAWIVATDVDELSENLPKEFGLAQNYPNPFNPSTSIKYQLPIQSYVTLKVYSLLGQEVATLVNHLQEPGYKSVQWDASSVASGMYFYRLQAGSFVDVKKLIILK